jgi:hypothetical protein
MSVSATILISPPEHLATLKDREALSDAASFTDADALKALDAITRQQPDVVVLERTFAATSRGAALINRIKADPGLVTCEIRIVAHDGSASKSTRRGADKEKPAGKSGAAAAAAVAEAPPAVAPLDQRGTRRAPRFKVVDEVEVMIDGNPATLIDVSVVGAMVISLTSLKPNQRVRLSLPDTARPIRVGAGVAWSAFEIPKSGPRYRAGIEFYDADPPSMERFIKANKKK